MTRARNVELKLDVKLEARTRAVEPCEFVAQGSTVVAFGHYPRVTKATEKRFDADCAMVFTLRDGRVASFRKFADSAGINAVFGELTVRRHDVHRRVDRRRARVRMRHPPTPAATSDSNSCLLECGGQPAIRRHDTSSLPLS